MLLPHGYEGQAPSTRRRPERFLQLCAQHNMQVCVPSTPGAGLPHAAPADAAQKFRKPLIVMSPKSLLRHKGRASLDEPPAGVPAGDRRDREARPEDRHAVLAPAPARSTSSSRTGASTRSTTSRSCAPRAALSVPTRIHRGVDVPEREASWWVQEEPQNQGAWGIAARLPAPTSPAAGARVRGRPIRVAGGRLRGQAQRRAEAAVEDAFAGELKSGEMVAKVAH